MKVDKPEDKKLIPGWSLKYYIQRTKKKTWKSGGSIYMTMKCPFRQIDNITKEPSSYCLKGDCPYDLNEENKCALFREYVSILKRIHYQLYLCMKSIEV